MSNEERKQSCIAKLSEVLNQRYGSKYTWSISTYTGTHSNVEGYCTEHKCMLYFTPTSIYRGTVPCKLCRGSVTDLQSFINKARSIHRDLYTYENSVYLAYHKKTTITCSKHGDFTQRVSDHLAGKGCTKCGNNIQNRGEIIDRFMSIHGNYYDYSKVVFNKMHEKIEIICTKHGAFTQKPSDHIFNKQGCPSCGSSGYSALKPAYFYILRVEKESKIFYKIGVTNKSLESRYSSSHDKKLISKCFLYKFTKGNLAQGLEQDLLRHYKSFKANQNILLSGNTEILTLDIRKDKTFKELFNEYRKKENPCGG